MVFIIIIIIIIIIQSLELHQSLNTWKYMTRVSFTLLICKKADKVFHITSDRREITQLNTYILTSHNVCLLWYVCMLVCKKNDTIKSENCFLLKMNISIDVKFQSF